MLPATKTRRWSLADVLPSSLGAILGRDNALGLQSVDKVVVVLVDGLGTHPLAARAGHARGIAPLVSRASTIDAGFPTTTASALATLTTGVEPGIHGLVGYSVLDSDNDRVLNQLNGWDSLIDPATWQRVPTVFERAADAGVPSFIVAAERYRHSGFTAAVLRGAAWRPGATIADRFEAARAVLDESDRAIVYLYIPELDSTAHALGCSSPEWTAQLEDLDAAVRSFTATLRRSEGMLLTADHGVLDVPRTSHVLFDEVPALVDGIRFVAGEPRCLQLHFEPDASESLRARTVDAWREAEGERSYVATRAEVITAGWFGPVVDSEVAPRIGDIIVAARKNIAYYDSRAPSQSGRKMIGQHGSISAAETSVPLLRFGAFAR